MPCGRDLHPPASSLYCLRCLIENGYVEPVEYADHLKVMMPCPPVHFSGYGRRPYAPTGAIGADTDAVLTEMGYTKEEIQKLRENGAIH